MRRNSRIVAGLAAVALVATLAFFGYRWWSPTARTTFVGFFANANGLYVGDEVRILGVSVGTIDKIEPQPASTKITFSVDAEYPVPADAKAAILSPSLVTARAIQLVPVYKGGPKLANGATIPLDRTAVPVEWDDFRRQLEKLTATLQPLAPGGVNTVGEFIDSAANNLRGEGDTARDTILKLSQAISALGDHSTDIFSTVRNLQLLVSALYSSSNLLAAFNQNLAAVSAVLVDSPNEVADATRALDGAVNDLRGFIADNREKLGTSFDRLASITTALNDSRADIKQILHVAPPVFQNFLNIYQPAQNTLTGVMAVNNLSDPIQFICSAIEAASRMGYDHASKLCMQYLVPIIKGRAYNFPPIGLNPFVGAQARPGEITYSEDRLRPGAPPPVVDPALAAVVPPPPDTVPLPAEVPAPFVAGPATEPVGLPGMMLPPPDGPP